MDWKLAARSRTSGYWYVIDQAEELFTRTTSDARRRFAEPPRDAVTGPARLVTAMRSEFPDDLRDPPALAVVPIEAYDIGGVQGALTRHADAALAGSARVSGLTDREIRYRHSAVAHPVQSPVSAPRMGVNPAPTARRAIAFPITTSCVQ
ncbi:MAG: hypothetical protein ACRDRS_07585 [Pseudonocardiaceae bacterium]